ncbi:MAG: DUF6441 family protein [Paracoccaceae bacterium]
MRIIAEIDQHLPEWAERRIDVWARAVTQGVAETAKAVQTSWRVQVGSVLGKRLAGTIRQQVFPKGQPSPNAAALVWSKAPEIVGAHERGALIRSQNGFFLAIPTEAAGRGTRGARLTPGEWEARRGIKLRFVYRAKGLSLLVADGARVNVRGFGVASRSKTGRGVATVPIFVLLPQVRLKKRLDLQGAAREGALSLPARIRAAAARAAR